MNYVFTHAELMLHSAVILKCFDLNQILLNPDQYMGKQRSTEISTQAW